jgi:hypothetical protein
LKETAHAQVAHRVRKPNHVSFVGILQGLLRCT